MCEFIDSSYLSICCFPEYKGLLLKRLSFLFLDVFIDELRSGQISKWRVQTIRNTLDSVLDYSTAQEIIYFYEYLLVFLIAENEVEAKKMVLKWLELLFSKFYVKNDEFFEFKKMTEEAEEEEYEDGEEEEEYTDEESSSEEDKIRKEVLDFFFDKKDMLYDAMLSCLDDDLCDLELVQIVLNVVKNEKLDPVFLDCLVICVNLIEVNLSKTAPKEPLLSLQNSRSHSSFRRQAVYIDRRRSESARLAQRKKIKIPTRDIEIEALALKCVTLLSSNNSFQASSGQQSNFKIEIFYSIYQYLNQSGNRVFSIDTLLNLLESVDENSSCFYEKISIFFINEFLKSQRKNKKFFKEKIFEIFRKYVLNSQHVYDLRWLILTHFYSINDNSSEAKVKIYDEIFYKKSKEISHSTFTATAINVNIQLRSFLATFKKSYFDQKLASEEYKKTILFYLRSFLLNLCAILPDHIPKIMEFETENKMKFHRIFSYTKFQIRQKSTSLPFISEFPFGQISDFFLYTVVENLNVLKLNFMKEAKQFYKALEVLRKEKIQLCVKISEMLLTDILEETDIEFDNRPCFNFGILVLFGLFSKIEQLLDFDPKLVAKARLDQICSSLRTHLDSLISLVKVSAIVMEFTHSSIYKRSDNLYRASMKYVIFYAINFMFDQINSLKNKNDAMLRIFMRRLKLCKDFLLAFSLYCDKKIIPFNLCLTLSSKNFGKRTLKVLIFEFMFCDFLDTEENPLIDFDHFSGNRDFYFGTKYGDDFFAKFEEIACANIKLRRSISRGIFIDYIAMKDMFVESFLEEMNKVSEYMIQELAQGKIRYNQRMKEIANEVEICDKDLAILSRYLHFDLIRSVSKAEEGYNRVVRDQILRRNIASNPLFNAQTGINGSPLVTYIRNERDYQISGFNPLVSTELNYGLIKPRMANPLLSVLDKEDIMCILAVIPSARYAKLIWERNKEGIQFESDLVYRHRMLRIVKTKVILFESYLVVIEFGKFGDKEKVLKRTPGFGKNFDMDHLDFKGLDITSLSVVKSNGSGEDDCGFKISVFDLGNLEKILPSKFLHRKTSVVMRFKCSDNLKLTFTSEKNLKKFLGAFDFRYQQMIADPKNETKGLLQAWFQEKISNFEFLLELNSLASRDLTDISQYPIFPWVTLSLDKLEDQKHKFRSLEKNTGFMINAKNRVSLYTSNYEKSKIEDSETCYYFENSPSSPFITLDFMLRLEPFTTGVRECDYYRVINESNAKDSFGEYLANFTEDETDLRELIPEFFYLPEMVWDSNRIFGGKIEGGLDLALPEWASNNPYTFVQEHRKILESKRIGNDLHHWVNLVFGCYRSGKKSEEFQNIFKKNFKSDPKIQNKIRKLLKNDQRYLHETYFNGSLPDILFPDKEITQRKKNSCGSKLVFEGKKSKTFVENIHSPFKKYKVRYGLSYAEGDTIWFFTGKNLKKFRVKKNIIKKKQSLVVRLEETVDMSKAYYSEKSIQKLHTFFLSSYIARLELLVVTGMKISTLQFFKSKNLKLILEKKMGSEIITALDSNSDYIFVGLQGGMVVSVKLSPLRMLELGEERRFYFGARKAVLAIGSFGSTNLFVFGSLDGVLAIYNAETSEIERVFYLKSSIDQVIPIFNSPSFLLVHSKEANTLATISLSGNLIYRRSFDSAFKHPLKVTKGNYFQDCVIAVDSMDRFWVLGLSFLEIKKVELFESDWRDFKNILVSDRYECAFCLYEDGEIKAIKAMAVKEDKE